MQHERDSTLTAFIETLDSLEQLYYNSCPSVWHDSVAARKRAKEILNRYGRGTQSKAARKATRPRGEDTEAKTDAGRQRTSASTTASRSALEKAKRQNKINEEWGLGVGKDQKCAVCKRKAQVLCSYMGSQFCCGRPLCENCKCPSGHGW